MPMVPTPRGGSNLPLPPGLDVIRLTGILRGGIRLIALCVFIVLVGMLSPRLSPTQAGVVAFVGFGAVVAGSVMFAVSAHHMDRSDSEVTALRAARSVLTLLRRIGLPILALLFFLLWTFVYLALFWFHPEEAFTGLAKDADPRFADFFYYSVMTALVSPPGDIIALSRGARSATMIEMLTGLSLLATYLSSLVDLPGRRGAPEAAQMDHGSASADAD
jgi:hypothetical protein